MNKTTRIFLLDSLHDAHTARVDPSSTTLEDIGWLSCMVWCGVGDGDTFLQSPCIPPHSRKRSDIYCHGLDVRVREVEAGAVESAARGNIGSQMGNDSSQDPRNNIERPF